MKETILVTGATGNVGSEVVKDLSSQDIRVRAGVHSKIKGDRFKAFENVEIVEMDFRKPESLQVALTGVTRLFLVTPFTEDQVTLAKSAIDMAKQTGVKQVVRLSAKGADAEPGIQLGRWHREIDDYLIHSGLAYAILRPGSFMQNFVNYYAYSIKNENSFYMPLGHGKVSYIDVRDIAAVAKTILTSQIVGNTILDLTGPEAISGQEAAQALSLATDRVITYIDVPEDAAHSAMLQQHMPPWMVTALMELNALSKAGFTADVTNTVEQVSGRTPHTFTDFSYDYAECF